MTKDLAARRAILDLAKALDEVHGYSHYAVHIEAELSAEEPAPTRERPCANCHQYHPEGRLRCPDGTGYYRRPAPTEEGLTQEEAEAVLTVATSLNSFIDEHPIVAKLRRIAGRDKP